MSSRDVPVYCVVQDTLERRALRRKDLWSREVWSAAGNTGTDVAGGLIADVVVDWVERDAFEEPVDDVDLVLGAVPDLLAARR